MNKITHNVLLLCFFFALNSLAIGQDLKLLATIPSSINFFTTDPLGNSYILTGNELTQYDSLGIKKLSYGQRNFGRMRCVDASNPMKVMLLYPDFARLEVLDSKLALQRSIDLRAFGIEQPLLACTSLNSGIWIFDQQDFQLKKYNEQMQILSESGNIAQRIDMELHPKQLVEHDNLLYLNNPETGILVFDAYGAYLKRIPLAGIAKIAFSGEQMLYCRAGKMYAYDLKKLEENPFTMPFDLGSSFEARIEQHKLFLNKVEKIEIYRFRID